MRGEWFKSKGNERVTRLFIATGVREMVLGAIVSNFSLAFAM